MVYLGLFHLFLPKFLPFFLLLLFQMGPEGGNVCKTIVVPRQIHQKPF
jgi:hypothetical protein